MEVLAAVQPDSAELAGNACCVLYVVLLIAVPAVAAYASWLAIRALRKYTRKRP